MPLLPAKVNRKQGHNSRKENVVKSEIKLDLTIMVPDIEYKFQVICFWGTQVMEWKPNVGPTEMGKMWCKKTSGRGINNVLLWFQFFSL